MKPNANVKSMGNSAVSLLLALAALFGSVSAIQGAIRTWDGSYSIYWSAAANWVENDPPSPGDDLVFPAGAANLHNYNNLGHDTYASITFTGSGYTLDGLTGSETIGLSGGIDTTAAGSVNTIKLNIDLGSSQNFDASSSTAILYVNGDVDLGSYTLTLYGSGSVHIGGVVSGTGGITKSGYSSTHWLEGAAQNSYTGPTVVEHGTLMLAKTSGNAVKYGSLTVGNDLSGADTAIVREQVNYQIGDSVPSTINSDGWLDVDDYIDTVGAITFNGGHAGSSATGLLRLGGNVTANAATSEALFDGNVYISGTRMFNVANGTPGYDLRVNAVVTDGGLIKTGSGNMALYGASTYTGATTVNEGGLYVRNNSALGTTAGGTTATGTGFIYLVGNSVLGEPLTLNRPASSGIVLYASSTSLWSGDIVLDEDARISCSGSLELGGIISGAGGITFSGAGDLILSGSANNVYTGPTVVQDGRLLMDKTSPYWAVGYGSLTVGDSSGAEESAIARELGSYQLASIPITVNEDGLLDLNNFSDTVGNSLTLNGGDVETGIGTITLGANSQITAGSSWPPSHVSGNINVGSGACTVTVPDLLYFDASVSGSANITKTGGGYMYLMSSNSFTGTMTVDQGILETKDPWSLGSDAAGTYVNNAARLGVHTHIGNETLTMNSSYGNGAIVSSGFYIPPGSNSWAGAVTLLQDTTIAVVSGYVMNVSGPIDGAGGLVKMREGVLTLSGIGHNTFDGDVMVEEGLLQMDKSGQSIPHSLVIGGNDPGDPGAVARQLDVNEIYDHVTINTSGTYDLDGNNETIRDLNLNGGADIDTGSAILTVINDVNVDPLGGTNVVSEIDGQLEFIGGGTQNLNVADTPSSSGGDVSELKLHAAVSGSASLRKDGEGTLWLSSSNSFTGAMVVDNGILFISNPGSLGSTVQGLSVNNDATLLIVNTHVGGESLTLNSTGTPGWNTVSARQISGWSGPVTLQSTANIYVSDEFDISGSIGGLSGLMKWGTGTLTYSGSAANTYLGVTYVNQGTLELGKTILDGAVPGLLVIGDGAGGAEADVVRLTRNNQIANSADVTITSSGLFDLDNYYDRMNAVTGSGSVELDAGHLIAGHNNSIFIFNGMVSGSGYLWKVGSGIWTLTADNTYSGITRVETGSLIVNGSQPSSDVYVYPTGTLGGIGTVGEIDSDGSVAPGTSAGQLSSGSAGLQSGSTFNVELDGYTGVDYDQLDVGGSVKLGNPDLAVVWGFVPALGDSFTIIDNDGTDAVAGTFNGLAEGASLVAGNVTLQVTYAGGTGNDVVLSATDVQPLEKLQIISIDMSGGSANLEWMGGVPFFVVEKKSSLTNATWTAVTAPTRSFVGSVPAATSNGFYRVTGGN